MNHTELALKSWYKPDNPLYHNPEPAVLGLAGEVGECIEQWKKHLYKPDREYDRLELLDERGDIWWYYRIVVWVYGYDLNLLLRLVGQITTKNDNQLETLGLMYEHAGSILSDYICGKPVKQFNLIMLLAALLKNIELLDCDIDTLTEFNYDKLSQPGQNGWEKAR